MSPNELEQGRPGAIRSIAEPILAQESIELVDLIYNRHGRFTTVRLLVDKVGGITIQECTHLNRVVGTALDEANVITESYTLEVSSPGLDRPLSTKRDF